MKQPILGRKVVEMLEKSRWRYIGTVGMTQLIVSFPNTCLMESFYTFWASSSLLSSSHGVTRRWCGPSSKRFTASHRCKRKGGCAAGSKGSKTGRPCPSLALNMRRTSTGGASPLKPSSPSPSCSRCASCPSTSHARSSSSSRKRRPPSAKPCGWFPFATRSLGRWLPAIPGSMHSFIS